MIGGKPLARELARLEALDAWAALERLARVSIEAMERERSDGRWDASMARVLVRAYRCALEHVAPGPSLGAVPRVGAPGG